MNTNYYNINRELNMVKKDIKFLKHKSNLIHTNDEIDSRINNKIDETFINNNTILKLNMDILNLKISLMNIKNDIYLFKDKLISKKNVILNAKFIKFLHTNNYYDLELIEKMGCQEIEDLLLLTEDELIKFGITIIDAKKLLKAAKKHIESNSFSVNYV